MKHLLPNLPYSKTALAPIMSAETLEIHHGKHHKHYVDTLNQLIPGTKFANLTLEEIVREASGPIYNNAAQAWNHGFFWKCLSPDRMRPSGDFLYALERDFISLEHFAAHWKEAGKELFGSGWVWLVQDSEWGNLSIETTSNADNPLKAGKIPILTCDVWEHAYYLDYRDERPKFLDAAFNLLNWEFAAQNLAAARESEAA